MKHFFENDRLHITFEDYEVKYMRQMLEAEMEEELKIADKYTKELRKAIRNKDNKKLYELQNESHLLYHSYFTEEEINTLEDTMEYFVPIELFRIKFMNRLRSIDNREFIDDFKELIKITIEEERHNYFKEQYLKELAEI